MSETAEIEIGFICETDDYEIKQWKFGGQARRLDGWNDCFCIVIIRSGQCGFNSSGEKYLTHTGHVLLEKPCYEYALTPIEATCTIFSFSMQFYEKMADEQLIRQHPFFLNKRIISQCQIASPAIDYLHYKALGLTTDTSRLETDDLVYELLYQVLSCAPDQELTDNLFAHPAHQLQIVERAKEYIHAHFREDIGLQEIARNSYASPFYFSRLFKKYTRQTPHQYLLNIRLKHGEMLLKNTDMSIGEIALASGFMNPDYFSTAFKKHYKLMPSLLAKRNHA